MSPLDDELRAVFSARAGALQPSPDPFAGVERRARRMRRNRVAASVAGAALAVSAIAVAVPMLGSSTVTVQPAPPATAPSSEAPEPAASRFALDPANPWAYRGDPDVAVQGDLDAYTVEWAARHGVLIDDVNLVPLFGQVYEPAATPELVFLVRQQSTNEAWWGVAQATESGPELVVDVRLSDGTTALPAGLPGDEVARLLVVAAPEVAEVQYGPDATSEWTTMESIAAGVAITPLEGDPGSDRVRGLAPDGLVVFEGAAPDPTRSAAEMAAADAAREAREAAEGEGEGTATGPTVDTAGYELDLDAPWKFRGDATVRDALAAVDGTLLGQWPGRTSDGYDTHALYAGRSDAETSYVMQLHDAIDGSQVVLTTTTQRGDRAPEQTVQPVDEAMLLVQALVPTGLGDGSVLLVALASPDASELVLQQDRARPDDTGDPGVGLWLLEEDQRAGEVLLYRSGDGLLYHSASVPPS
jgi:hypothetical protein